jgi:hypothetical protein
MVQPFATDDDYKVHFPNRMTPDGGIEILRLTEDGG